MSTLSNMQRKILFATGILLLFVGMYPYKQYLDRVAKREDLGEATIGSVDTGSFVLKLFLLGGFRGMAANVLWTRAIDFQRVQEWDKLKVTVDMITKLQPHFLAIWTFQSWNLTYNVSVEWDAPEDKYDWIKQGILFVRDGVAKNKRSPDLIWDTAWYYYHKLGFSDESIILRRLFRDDKEESFKRSPLAGQNVYDDNFLLGRDWFDRAVQLVDVEGVERQVVGTTEDIKEYVDAPQQRKGRPGDLPFRSMPAHAQTRYAIGLEKESIKGIPATFGPKAKDEWSRSYAKWVDFASHIYDSPNQVAVNGKPVTQKVRLADNAKTGAATYNTLLSTDLKATGEDAKRLLDNQKYWADRWADQMNLPYWEDRCLAERETEGTTARRLFYEGTRAYKSGDFPLAFNKYKEGVGIWKTLLDKHQFYRDDELNRKDTGLVMKRYARAAVQTSQELPKDTPFQDLLKAYEGDSSVDPFDALEMLDAADRASGSKTKPAAAPAPGGAAPAPAPAPASAPR